MAGILNVLKLQGVELLPLYPFYSTSYADYLLRFLWLFA